MSTPKIIRATRKRLRQIMRTTRNIPKAAVNWVLRGLLLIGRRAIWSNSGFVLPTAVLLILVVTLTVGAIGYRTFTRSQQTIGERQQRQIYNAATPAIERAKAKLEFLFDTQRDPRGGTVPSEGTLLGMLYNDGKPVAVGGGSSITIPKFTVAGASPSDNIDPYTFPGETRVDLDNPPDGRLDNAWKYVEDANGDGDTDDKEDATVVYSIILRSTDPNTGLEVNLRDQRKSEIANRALRQQIRNAPLSNATLDSLGCATEATPANPSGRRSSLQEQGWFSDPNRTTLIRKNFQIDAFVQRNTPNGTVSTLELQQDRQATRGFKWAVWFRNDLEIFPGSQFNLNGAVHTEGSLIAGAIPTGISTSETPLRFYMISAPRSCLYTKEASDLTVANVLADPKKQIPAFQGQFITGSVRDDNYNGGPRYDLWSTNGPTEANGTLMTSALDSVKTKQPVDYALDPVELYTRDNSVARGFAAPSADERYIEGNPQQDPDWPSRKFNDTGNGRLLSSSQATPYVDDVFRADDRYGPKPRYGTQRTQIQDLGASMGADIVNEPKDFNLKALGQVTDDKLEDTNVGLDGYWERRARNEGLRLIVSQRLELGDPAGWGGPMLRTTPETTVSNEPLRPWNNCLPDPSGGGAALANKRCNEKRQLRTLWDNLAAVQAMVVYHGRKDKDFPMACFATTVHPGTATTLARSATFENLAFGVNKPQANPTDPLVGYQDSDAILSDFFRGRGTNGWEYNMPPLSEFETSNSELMKALTNLAYFAGDPLGGSPSFPVVQSDDVHPFPSMAMWGDFSVLRNILKPSTASGRSIKSYSELSPADKTTLHSAGCMISMLAYNIDYLNKLDYNANAAQLTALNEVIKSLREGDDPATSTLSDTLPILIDREKTVAFGNQLIEIEKNRNPEDLIRLLEYWRDRFLVGIASPTSAQIEQRRQLNQAIYLAQLITTKEQVERDRLYGFDGVNSVGESDANRLSRTCEQWKLLSDTDPLGQLKYLCSARPRFPILYSLFPLAEHGDYYFSSPNDQSISQTPINPDPLVPLPVSSPLKQLEDEGSRFDSPATRAILSGMSTQPLIGKARDKDDTDNVRVQRYIQSANRTNVADDAKKLYQSVNIAKLVETAKSGPKQIDQWLEGGWAGLVPSPGSGTTANNSQANLIKVCTRDPVTGAPNNSTADPNDATSDLRNTPCYRPISAQRYRIPFKDAAFFNGRELMSVRALDIDIDLLRKRKVTEKDDAWLPRTGIVYAFREDAVSEINIVRPPTRSWSFCGSEAKLNNNTSNCQMQTENQTAWGSEDPPVSNITGITVKPVDYFADPDRRPHGFRLKNGTAVWRSESTSDKLSERGISFITDNPAYIQGPFNLHRRSENPAAGSTDSLEEFDFTDTTQRLASDFSNFYTRTRFDDNFVKQRDGKWQDQWRPSEIIADAVTLLSVDFCDGSIEDGLYFLPTSLTTTSPVYTIPTNYVRDRYGCLARTSNESKTSYYNQYLPTNLGFTPRPTSGTTNTRRLARTSFVESYLPSNNGSTLEQANSRFEPESPIVLDRGGVPVIQNTNATLQTFGGVTYETIPSTFNAERPKRRRLIYPQDDTQMNMILVSGIVPSRKQQTYGGLHNFPRFLEDWDRELPAVQKKRLAISGALVQLNFSTYATAPFDQERWHPSDPTSNGNEESEGYYGAPVRRWGYDVGLQFAPVSPIAERFKSANKVRAEFYTEPSATDPYIVNLCKQISSNCPAE